MKKSLKKNYYTRLRMNKLRKLLNNNLIVVECLKSGWICSFNFTISDHVRDELVNKFNLSVCDQGNCLCDETAPPVLQRKLRIDWHIKKF